MVLALAGVAFSACSTDDVDVAPPDTGNLYAIPDDAFGDYLTYLQIPAVVPNAPGSATKYSIDVDVAAATTDLALVQIAFQKIQIDLADARIVSASKPCPGSRLPYSPAAS